MANEKTLQVAFINASGEQLTAPGLPEKTRRIRAEFMETGLMELLNTIPHCAGAEAGGRPTRKNTSTNT